MQNHIPRTFVGSTIFTVDGMTCGHCRNAVTTAICAVPGVDAVDVNLTSGAVTVSATTPVDRADIAAAVKEAGYTLRS